MTDRERAEAVLETLAQATGADVPVDEITVGLLLRYAAEARREGARGALERIEASITDSLRPHGLGLVIDVDGLVASLGEKDPTNA